MLSLWYQLIPYDTMSKSQKRHQILNPFMRTQANQTKGHSAKPNKTIMSQKMGASRMAQWVNMPEGKPAKLSSIPGGPVQGESLSFLPWKQTGESKNISTVYSRKPAESASTRQKMRTNTHDKA